MTDVAPPPGFRPNGVPLGAIALIVAGTIFLLNNYAALPWSVWREIARLWPLLFIVVGVQMVFGRGWIVKLLLSLVVVAAIGLVVLVSLAKSNASVEGWLNKVWPEWRQSSLFEISRDVTAREVFTVPLTDYAGATSRQMNFQVGIGQLILTDSGGDETHLTLAARYAGNERPIIEKSFNNGRLEISLKTPHMTRFFFPETTNWEWDGKIGQSNLPTAFDIDLGAGNLRADFRNQKITNMTVNVGAGQAAVRLSPAATPTEGLKTRVGAGSLEIKTTKDVGLKVIYSTGVGNVSVGTLILRGSGEYTSPDYDVATSKLTVEITLGGGEVNIDHD